MNIPDISPLYTNNWQTILGQILKNIPAVIENTYKEIIELNKQQQLYDAITSSIALYIFLISFENNPNLTLSTKEALE